MLETFQDIQFGSPIDRGKRATENKWNIYLRTNRTFKKLEIMANWCSNSVAFEGNETALEQVKLEFIKNATPRK